MKTIVIMAILAVSCGGMSLEDSQEQLVTPIQIVHSKGLVSYDGRCDTGETAAIVVDAQIQRWFAGDGTEIDVFSITKTTWAEWAKPLYNMFSMDCNPVIAKFSVTYNVWYNDAPMYCTYWEWDKDHGSSGTTFGLTNQTMIVPQYLAQYSPNTDKFVVYVPHVHSTTQSERSWWEYLVYGKPADAFPVKSCFGTDTYQTWNDVY